nr:transposase (putative), gypsy type [Tanacetum cinerariifolium]
AGVIVDCMDHEKRFFLLSDREKLNLNHPLIRRYLEEFLCIVGLNRSFVDVDARPTLLGPDKNGGCWFPRLLNFVKSADPFKIKVRERTLVKGEVPLLTKTADMVVVPSDQTVRLVDHTIIDEIKEHSRKNKRKVGLIIVSPPIKKARTSDITITEPVATSARKSLAFIQKLIAQSSQADVGSRCAASRAKEFVSSSVTPTPDHGDHEDSSSTHDENIQTRHAVENVTAKPVDGAVGDSIPGNEDGFSHNHSDADFLDLVNVNYAHHICMTSKLRLRYEHEITVRERFKQKFIHSSVVVRQMDAEIASLKDKLRKAESEATTNAELLGSVSGLELVCDGLKNKVAKLEVNCESLRGEVAGETKMREDLASMQDTTARHFDELDACIVKLNHDMDAELYPYMPTAIARHRLVIGYGFCLAVMKCAQSIKSHATLGKVISMAINKGDHGDEDPTPKFHKLQPFSAQVTVHVYFECGVSRGPDSISHEILLFDVIAASHTHSKEHKKAHSQIGCLSMVTPSLSSQGASLCCCGSSGTLPSPEILGMDPKCQSPTCKMAMDRTPPITTYCIDLILMARALFASAGSMPSVRYSSSDVIHESSSSTTAKLVDVILLSAFALLFLLLSICSMQDFLNPLISAFAFSSPSTRDSYSASLLDALNSNLRAYVYSTPFGFVKMSLDPDPSRHEDLSVNRFHGSEISSSICTSAGGPSSSSLFAMKSAKNWPWMDVLSLQLISNAFSSKRHFNNLLDCAERFYISIVAAQRYIISSSFGLDAVSIGSFAMHYFIYRNAFFASVVRWKSLYFKHFFIVLKKGSNFSADLYKNLFRLASFPLRLCTSFNVLGDCSFITTSAFFRHALIPFILTTCPRNIPSSAPKVVNVHFQISLDLFLEGLVHQPLICCFDGTVWNFLRPDHPLIPLYGEGDQMIMKFIMVVVKCSSSPSDTISDIFPNC